MTRRETQKPAPTRARHRRGCRAGYDGGGGGADRSAERRRPRASRHRGETRHGRQRSDSSRHRPAVIRPRCGSRSHHGASPPHRGGQRRRPNRRHPAATRPRCGRRRGASRHCRCGPRGGSPHVHDGRRRLMPKSHQTAAVGRHPDCGHGGDGDGHSDAGRRRCPMRLGRAQRGGPRHSAAARRRPTRTPAPTAHCPGCGCAGGHSGARRRRCPTRPCRAPRVGPSRSAAARRRPTQTSTPNAHCLGFGFAGDHSVGAGACGRSGRVRRRSSRPCPRGQRGGSTYPPRDACRCLAETRPTTAAGPGRRCRYDGARDHGRSGQSRRRSRRRRHRDQRGGSTFPPRGGCRCPTGTRPMTAAGPGYDCGYAHGGDRGCRRGGGHGGPHHRGRGQKSR